MIMPEVQYPHCIAPSSRKACWTGCRWSPLASPSMVIVDLSATVLTGIWQERRAFPSTSTVHAPHCPSPQPYLLPVRSNCSRKTESRVASGSASTLKVWPLIVSFRLAMNVRLQTSARSWSRPATDQSSRNKQGRNSTKGRERILPRGKKGIANWYDVRIIISLDLSTVFQYTSSCAFYFLTSIGGSACPTC